MSKIRIAIEDVARAQAEAKLIRSVPLEDLEFTCNGQVLTVTPEALAHWRSTGLSNVDFAVHHFLRAYLQGLEPKG